MAFETDFTKFTGIDKKRLEEILRKIQKVRIALIGDICLDVYWRADMAKSELSRETPHFPLPVIDEWMSPGAGSNAASNIAALKPSVTHILGVIGKDWRGDVLKQELANRNIDTSSVITSSSRVTNAYCKPLRKGISSLEYEDPRIDFANYDILPKDDEEKLMYCLEQISGKIDILCVSDQFTYGSITPSIRDRIMQLAGQGLMVVVDSRDRIGLYKNVVLKPNEVEGYRAIYNSYSPEKLTFNELLTVAKSLSGKNSSKVCMTIGPKGCIYVDGSSVTHIPSYEVKPPIDTCGAGDTFLAAFSCALAAGAEGCEAAAFANLAADVTIKKINTTGTANPDEILARYSEI